MEILTSRNSLFFILQEYQVKILLEELNALNPSHNDFPLCKELQFQCAQLLKKED